MVRLFTPRLGRLDPLAGQGAGAAPRGGGAVRKGAAADGGGAACGPGDAAARLAFGSGAELRGTGAVSLPMVADGAPASADGTCLGVGGAAAWRPAAPVPELGRLVSWRYAPDEAFLAHLADGVSRWASAGLAAAGRVTAEIARAGGEASVCYSAPSLMASVLSDARFAPGAAPAPGPFPFSAVVTGWPASAPWDALLAPGVMRGDFRIRVHMLPLGASWLMEHADRMARVAAWADGFNEDRAVGTSSRRTTDPRMQAIRARALEERERSLGAGEHARFYVTVEASSARDLALANALLAAAMARASDGGAVVPPACWDVGRVEEGEPVREGRDGTPIAVAVPVGEAARFLAPPQRPVRGITAVNAAVDEGSPLTFAATGRDAAGEIALGAFESGAACCVPLDRFAQGMVVTGQPGMRKSTFVAGVARQLAAAGVRVVVLEPSKAEYAELLAHDRWDGVGMPRTVRTYGDERAGGAGAAGGRVVPLRENPLAVDEGVLPALWLQDVAACMVSAFHLEEQPLPLHLEALLRRVYRAAGVARQEPAASGARWPTVRDLLAAIDPYMDAEVCSGPEVRANVRGALVRRARSMCDMPALVAREGLMACDLLGGVRSQGRRVPTVVQLGSLGAEDGAFVGMVLLARLMAAARLLGRRPLHTVVVVEEAHALLRDRITGEPTLFARLYEQALAECRASGVGFVSVDQRPSLLPAGVLANSVTRVAFSSAHADDREAVARACGLVAYQERALSTLPAGEAVFVTEGSPAPDRIRATGCAGA